MYTVCLSYILEEFSRSDYSNISVWFNLGNKHVVEETRDDKRATRGDNKPVKNHGIILEAIIQNLTPCY